MFLAWQKSAPVDRLKCPSWERKKRELTQPWSRLRISMAENENPDRFRAHSRSHTIMLLELGLSLKASLSIWQWCFLLIELSSAFKKWRTTIGSLGLTNTFETAEKAQRQMSMSQSFLSTMESPPSIERAAIWWTWVTSSSSPETFKKWQGRVFRIGWFSSIASRHIRKWRKKWLRRTFGLKTWNRLRRERDVLREHWWS